MADDRLSLLTRIVELREDDLALTNGTSNLNARKIAFKRLEQAQKALWNYQDALVTGPDNAINSWMK